MWDDIFGRVGKVLKNVENDWEYGEKVKVLGWSEE